MNILKLFDLQLFAEGAATAAAGTSTGSTGEGSTTDVGANGETAVPTSKRKAKADPYANVKFGKQVDDPEATAAESTKAEDEAEGKKADGTSEVPSPTDGEKATKTYTEDEYKKGIEDAIKRRLKKNAEEKKASEPILRYVSEALGVDIDDIEGMARAAETARKQRYEDEAGRTGNDVETIERNADNAYNVRNYRQELDSLREAKEQDEFNTRMSTQEAEVLAAHPDFKYEEEIKNPVFRTLVRSGFSLKNAYESANHEKLLMAASEKAAKEAEQRVSASIAAGANRPMEGGATNPSAQVISDPKLLTKEQRAAVKARVRRGEKIIW